jgi:hypothetical protein
MAEAHQATSYKTSMIHEHTDANHDQEVLQLVWESGISSWRKRFARIRAKLRNGAYPAHLESLWIISALTMAYHFGTANSPFDVVKIVIEYMPEYVNTFFLLNIKIFYFYFRITVFCCRERAQKNQFCSRNSMSTFCFYVFMLINKTKNSQHVTNFVFILAGARLDGKLHHVRLQDLFTGLSCAYQCATF